MQTWHKTVLFIYAILLTVIAVMGPVTGYNYGYAAGQWKGRADVYASFMDKQVEWVEGLKK